MSSATKKASSLGSAEPLSSNTELLQVAYPEASNAFKGGVQDLRRGQSSACYLLSRDVQEALNLVGKHDHLWQLLKAHDKHHHADRHLATHVAHVMRQEEGYVLVNGHPGFEDELAMTGIINEPMANERPSVKMVQGYARFLPPDHPLLRARGLKQPAEAREAWREGILPPVGQQPVQEKGAGPLSEKMVVYFTTRRCYDLGSELTVDYGASYQRSYHSGTHRASAGAPLYPVPPEQSDPAARRAARFPQLPGWWNPRQQPTRRPAFRIDSRGAVVCVDDLPSVVNARKHALGLSTSPPCPPLVESAKEAEPSMAPASAASPRTPRRSAAVEIKTPATPVAPKKKPGRLPTRGGTRRGAPPTKPPLGQPLLPWATRGPGGKARALDWQCACCSAFSKPALSLCSACGHAPPVPDTGRRKRAREVEPVEPKVEPRKSLNAVFGWTVGKLRG